MGWRAWDHYEQQAKERWRALPWRERYPVRRLVWVLVVVCLAVAFLYASIARSDPIGAADVRAIDGDTIRVYQKRPDVRLVGFNAPETRRARCEAERKLGGKATRRLRQVVRTATSLDLQLVVCACRADTAGTQACNFGRRCGTLKANGRDVGAILIAEGLAVPFHCGRTSCPKLPRPWCG